MKRRIFGGSGAAMVAALFDGDEISHEEHREIRRLVLQRRRKA